MIGLVVCARNLITDSTLYFRMEMELLTRQRIGLALANFLYTQAIHTPAFVLSKIVLALAVFGIKFTDHEPDTIQKFCSNTILEKTAPCDLFIYVCSWSSVECIML